MGHRALCAQGWQIYHADTARRDHQGGVELMALGNIFKEPRREITETLLGISIVGPLIWIDWQFAQWFQEYTTTVHESYVSAGVPWPIGMMVGTLGVVLIIMAFFW